MPKAQPKVSVADLFDVVVNELDSSINRPNILSYGQKDYPEQSRFHKSNKRGRFISGGNRGGKTDSEVVEAIWIASRTHPYLELPTEWGRGPLQLRFVVVDVAKGVEQIMLPKFQRWMSKSMLVDGSWDKSWDKNNMILTFSNGSTIDFVTHGMELSKLGGVPRHVIFFDEEPPRHIFNECMSRLLDFNGWWVIAATPVSGMGWTYDLLWEPATEGTQDDPRYQEIDTFTLSVSQNPYVSAEEEDLNFYMLAMDAAERDMREHGSFVARSGLVFPNFKPDTHVIPADQIDFAKIKNWEWYSSTDFGWSNPTAWLWHAVSPTGDIVTFAEHYRGEMTTPEHAAVVHAREAAWGRVPDVRVGDPAGNQKQGNTGTSYIMEYALREINIQTEGIPHEVEIGIEKMQQYFRVRQDTGWGKDRPTWVISSNCVNLIREMKKLQWETYSSEKLAYALNKKEGVKKKDDHAWDSARYFATLMPDLTPSIDEVSQDGIVPTTVSYFDMMIKLSNDPGTTFLDNEMSKEGEVGWDTTYSMDDYL